MSNVKRRSRDSQHIIIIMFKPVQDRLIIFGSYTPGKLDTDSFKGQGVYQVYKQTDIERKFTQRNDLYYQLTGPTELNKPGLKIQLGRTDRKMEC